MFRLMLESGNVKANVGVRLHYCQCWVQFMLRLMLGSAYVRVMLIQVMLRLIVESGYVQANFGSGYAQANVGLRLCYDLCWSKVTLRLMLYLGYAVANAGVRFCYG